jgi:nicotinamide phosphoribosyltransferase
MNSLITQTDSYKVTHWPQYPPGTEKVYSYLESRGGQFSETVFFGLQYYLKKYFKKPITKMDLLFAKQLYASHFGTEKLFNEAGWEHILYDHAGRMPIRIKAVPEGSVIPTHNVLMTIENTCPKCYWLTNWLESLLLKVWYPTTVATASYSIKKVLLDALRLTGDPNLVDFKLHDFGYRGVSSEESAGIGGLAHLINFKGTDSIAPLIFAQEYYHANGAVGFSIPASEHSTITSWGKESEAFAFKNMLQKYPTGMVSCVSDSYDIYNACENLWGGLLRQDVMKRDGVLIIRPDSGKPTEVVLNCLNILGEKFGYETNSKGYKVLCPKVRLIQGDGVNYWSIIDILNVMSSSGWSADNIAFGMGGALLQGWTRDTQKFAIKCSNITRNGVEIPVWKKPVTDSGKDSKRGRLALVKLDSEYRTVNESIVNGDNILQKVFENGNLLIEENFETVRQRALL